MMFWKKRQPNVDKKDWELAKDFINGSVLTELIKRERENYIQERGVIPRFRSVCTDIEVTDVEKDEAKAIKYLAERRGWGTDYIEPLKTLTLTVTLIN